MKATDQVVETPIIFIAVDQADDHYRFRQAFGEAEPGAVLYFFMQSSELIGALRGTVYPRPSLLIMDWDMDRSGGYDTLLVMAQIPAWQTIPVVVMTASGKPVDEVRCRHIGYGLVIPAETEHEKLVRQLTGLLYALL